MPRSCLDIIAEWPNQVIVIWKGIIFIIFSDSMQNFAFVTKTCLAETNSCVGEGHFKKSILKANIR